MRIKFVVIRRGDVWVWWLYRRGKTLDPRYVQNGESDTKEEATNCALRAIQGMQG